MSAEIGQGTVAVLGTFALWRFRQWMRAISYQRNLRRLPVNTLPANRIPVSNRQLFLGLGFRWGQEHTQRLRDTERPWAKRYIQPNALYRFARRAEIAWEKHSLLGPLVDCFRADVWWNPVRPLPDVGGKPAIHGVEPKKGPVHMPLGDRVGHTLVLGTTRVGKTRLAEILITQDIVRGDVVPSSTPRATPI